NGDTWPTKLWFSGTMC
ncbi:hypothetical protein CP061683_1101B, partial [Chlamydia psittaci 06-1683]